jgi:hypothetical protein
MFLALILLVWLAITIVFVAVCQMASRGDGRGSLASEEPTVEPVSVSPGNPVGYCFAAPTAEPRVIPRRSTRTRARWATSA